MDKNKRLTVWLPVIIAASIALGIFIGNHYLSISQGKKRSYSSGNKINAILDIIDEQYVDTVSMSKLVESTIPKIFSELDPHSVYIPAEDASVVNEELEGSFSGIGVSFNMQTDTILVISVISGGPAEKAGLLPFDRIISINDSIFSGKKKNQGEIMKTLRGAKNSTVKLGVQRGNSPELLYFDVTRGDVPVNSVDVSYEAAKGIGYIKVSKFARNTYNEFITAIAKLKQAGCTSFVIDLRGNTGDYRDMVSDEQWQQEFAESQRQFNEQLAFDKQQYADSLAASAASAGGSGSSAGRSSSRSSRSSKSSSDDTVQYWISKIDPMAGSGQSYDSSTRAGKVGIANMINNGYKKGNLTKAQAKSIAAHYGISID